MTRPIITRTRAEVFQLWIDALRSGNYQQTQYCLKTDKGFCCLGVLCDLARQDGGPAWNVLYSAKDGQLPNPILRFMGLRDFEQNHLAAMNDTACATFSQISDNIEQLIMPKALARP